MAAPELDPRNQKQQLKMSTNASEKVIIPEDDKVLFPKLMLAGHIMAKGMQMGSVAGMVTGLPIFLYKAKTNKSFNQSLLNTVAHTSITGAKVGLGVFVVAATYFNFKLDQDGIEDRSFRLYHNPHMHLWEPMAFGGSLLGAAAAKLIFKSKALPFAALGLAVGTVSYFAIDGKNL